MTTDLSLFLDLLLFACGALCVALLTAPAWLLLWGWWDERRERQRG